MRRVLAVVLFLNVAVAVTKLTVGVRVGALALLADGVHSLLDASSNVVGLVGLAIAGRPPDSGHPYGHRRFETLAAACIGLLIAGGLVEIVRQLYEGVTGTREPPQVTPASIVVVAATIAVNLGISFYERRRGRTLGSAILVADAGHTASDALGATVVLGSFIAAMMGNAWADLAGAGIVCIIIARTAWSVISSNVSVLADHARLDPDAVRKVAMAVDGVRDAIHIRSRGPADHVHVDLHVILDPELSLRAAHAKTHDVKDALHAAFPEVVDVVIHAEPGEG